MPCAPEWLRAGAERYSRVASTRRSLAESKAVEVREASMFKLFLRVDAARYRRQASLHAADATHTTRFRKAVRVWRRPPPRARAYRSIARRAGLRALLRHAYPTPSLRAPVKLAFTAAPSHGGGCAGRARSCSRPRVPARHRHAPHQRAERSEAKEDARKLSFAAKWHWKTSAHQHVLARLLINGWKRKQDRERTAQAHALGLHSRVIGTLRRWRFQSISPRGSGARRRRR